MTNIDTQPEALRIAAALEYCDASVARQAINELRRLHAENAALHQAMTEMKPDLENVNGPAVPSDAILEGIAREQAFYFAEDHPSAPGYLPRTKEASFGFEPHAWVIIAMRVAANYSIYRAQRGFSPQVTTEAKAYCEPCQRVGMSNCSDFTNCGQPKCVTCHRPLAAQAQQIAQDRADAARLEFVGSYNAGCIRLDDRAALAPLYLYWRERGDVKTVREAIDAARAAASGAAQGDDHADT